MKTTILYEDEHILICRKPAGLAVESAAIGQMDMVSELKNYLKNPWLGVIHRLDQPVEGLLVFAKNSRAAANLSEQLQKNILQKQYLAAVCGSPRPAANRLVDYIRKDPGTRRSQITQKGQPGAKEAVLMYEVLDTTSLPSCDHRISLLGVRIETGRFHQIRAQLSHAGHPLLGDRKYETVCSKEASEAAGADSLALCASRLDFVHPFSGKKLCFQMRPTLGAFALFEEKLKKLDDIVT